MDRALKTGFCKSSSTIKIARASRHMWEEPCISGENGSGTVFFSGCNLNCVYCQNHDISSGKIGLELNKAELKDLFLRINESNVHNINLVTPTHYLPLILEVIATIKGELRIPIVCNCSGYEKEEYLDNCKGLIEIFLTDFKYKSSILSKNYSNCSDYFDVAISALKKMIEVTGTPNIKNGIMTSGVIVRHLILPSHKDDSIDIMNELYNNFGNESFLVSLMCQFTPTDNCKNFPELNRRLTSLEYKRVTEVYEKLNFKGYVQERASASKSYIPDFKDTGEFLNFNYNI